MKAVVGGNREEDNDDNDDGNYNVKGVGMVIGCRGDGLGERGYGMV